MKIPKPQTALILIPCECGGKGRGSLIPGHNNVWVGCQKCGAVLHYEVNYDGYGMATIISGTIEKVDPYDAQVLK